MSEQQEPRNFQDRSEKTVSLRPAQATELSRVLEWVASEGWNPGHDDAAAFFATDPNGFFTACVDGEPVAAISVVNHSDTFAFLGLYLCLPAYRGRGIGFALWQYALEHAGDRIVGLDGIPDQQGNYRKSGFALSDQTFRFEGRVDGQAHTDVRAARTLDIPELCHLVKTAQGYDTSKFLTGWFEETSSRLTFVLERDGKITGLATRRACREGSKVGPLVAKSLDDAKSLLRHVALETATESLIIDVPESSSKLTDYCKSLGMTVSFNTARMYKGPAPAPSNAVFSVSTLELG